MAKLTLYYIFTISARKFPVFRLAYCPQEVNSVPFGSYSKKYHPRRMERNILPLGWGHQTNFRSFMWTLGIVSEAQLHVTGMNDVF